jgi:hypothetical protein
MNIGQWISGVVNDKTRCPFFTFYFLLFNFQDEKDITILI